MSHWIHTPLTRRWLRASLILLCVMSSADLRADEAVNLSLLVQSLSESKVETQQSLMKGMLKGLEGRRNVPAPPAWPDCRDRLMASSNATVRGLTEQLAQTFGDEDAVLRALELLRDPDAKANDRQRALLALVTRQDQRLLSVLPQLLDEDKLRREAIRALGAFDSPNIAKTFMDRFASFSAEEQRAILDVLATRKSYGNVLVEAMTSKQVSRQQIPAHVARSLENLLGESFTSVYGEVRQLTQDREAVMKKYKQRLTPKALARADSAAGRAVFQKTCAACHLMYGEGGKIGPDLTGSNRANLDYLLLNSVDPSFDVPEGYRMVIIQTVDGRVLNGVIAEENEHRIVLKTVDQPQMVILKSDIEARKVSAKSIMPDGQLDQLSTKDVLNLVKYMQTIQQVELPE